MADSIDIFDFISLSGPGGGDTIEFVYQHAALQQRPGIDGTALIQLGEKGDPFQLMSIRDVVDFPTAQALRVLYSKLKGTEPRIVVLGGTNYWTTIQHKYFVLNVESRAKRVGACAGGLLGGAGTAIVEALWTLCPVYLEPTP